MVCISFTAAVVLQWWRSVVEPETIRPAEPAAFTTWPFTEKVHRFLKSGLVGGFLTCVRQCAGDAEVKGYLVCALRVPPV